MLSEKSFFDFHLSKVGGKLIFLGNLAPKDARKLDIKDDFIQELIELWADFNYRDSFASKANFSVGHIWNNSMIKIAGKTIFYKHWANAGVMKINDLMTSDSRIISYNCFKEKFSSFIPRILWSSFGYQECYEISGIVTVR